MTTTASPAAVAGYIHALMHAFDPASPPGRRIADWLRYNDCVAGIDFAAATALRTRAARKRKTPPHDKPLPPRAWEKLRAAVAASADRAAANADALAANAAILADALGLGAEETAILQLVLRTDRESRFDDLCSRIVATRAVSGAGLAGIMLRCSPSDVADRVRRGPLAALQLVGVCGDGTTSFDYYVPYRIRQALSPPSDGLADVERRLIGTPLQPRLTGEDFAHVAKERDFVVRLLRGASAARHKGVNILLYGPPGTGKTELCKVIAAQLGCDLFAIGEADEDGDEPSRGERVDALRLADRLAMRRAGTLLLFDEMEDVLQHGERLWSDGRWVRRAGSKVFFNRLLEQNNVPVLWTANTLCEFDPAFLRRMSFALEMPAPPAKVRARLWDGLAREHGLTLSAADTTALARRHRVAPGLMVSATQAVATARGGPEEVDFAIQALARPLVGRLRPAEAPAPFAFEPALTNADADLAGLTAALVRPGAPRDVTLCLYGPPGTGKSAFARRLADAMGLDPLVKRGSDLLSKWIGETERLIAEAFDEALKDERFLIIDEAEAFLWSRAGAEKSWEVSMVNELLVSMEAHPLPFACTTNHLQQIDAAALRRFTFKVKFDYMTAAQTAAAYRRFFDRDPPAALSELIALTPGDFAAVGRKLRFMGDGARSDGVLVRLLEQEMAIKNLPRRIGF
jgi:ATP-dependent 26S proteasome regulatory subunit